MLTRDLVLASLSNVLNVVLKMKVLHIIRVIVTRDSSVVGRPRVDFNVTIDTLIMVVVYKLLTKLLPTLHTLTVGPVRTLKRRWRDGEWGALSNLSSLGGGGGLGGVGGTLG